MSTDKFIKLSEQFVYADFTWWGATRRSAIWPISQIREIADCDGRQTKLWLIGQDDESPHLLEIPLDAVRRTLLGPPTGIDNLTDTAGGA